MADYWVCSDNIDGKENSRIDALVSALKKAGHNATNGGVGPNTIQSHGQTSAAKGQIGAFICGGVDIQVFWDFVQGIGSYYHYDKFIYVYASDTATSDKWLTCNGAKNTPTVQAHDDNYSGGQGDAIGKTVHEYCSEHKDKVWYACGPLGCSFDDVIQNFLSGAGAGSGSGNKNKDDEEEEEDWGDRDNFTPHKGKIMQIKPYKEIASVNFDKSYDSPTGTGEVEILYSSRDYRYIYKGVAMKLKLRRTCDDEWSATGLEEPDYEEKEIFFKEHIPTDELLKELGLPNYRKEMMKGGSSLASTSSDTSSEDSDSENSDNSSSSDSNSNSSSNSSNSSSGNSNS